MSRVIFDFLAESVGFEPTALEGAVVFKTTGLIHSPNSPYYSGFFQTNIGSYLNHLPST